MCILFLTEFFPTTDGGEISGGAESRTYYLAHALSKKHDVSIITSYLPDPLRFEDWNGLKIYRVGPRRNYLRQMGLFYRGLFFLSAIFKSLFLNFDIIDANNGVVYFCAWLVAKLKNKKLVYWVPDVVGFKEWRREQGFGGGLIAWILESATFWFPADQTIALSETTRKKLSKIKNTIVIYPGV